MSDTLRPKAYGIETSVRRKKALSALCCRVCSDPIIKYLWSDFYCPDCDIKRMKRLNDSFKEIESVMFPKVENDR